ncbi:hypothetical protein DOTSEDRAFT_69076 [Dothistroma septosporum NZE10]|uniref:Uncharacterized protein n=1 Tax=Dothistroma septosporum (strain NZE10 / CBS 128990) TaxID=675120 RepID=N1PU23_DOTSN|nr:hypothetical protein DOTSEDRAFT_69076 [Dothistroma septosporum NZE10]
MRLAVWGCCMAWPYKAVDVVLPGIEYIGLIDASIIATEEAERSVTFRGISIKLT